MAIGWAVDNAVNEQIDATVKDGIRRAQNRVSLGTSLSQCELWAPTAAAARIANCASAPPW